ncbi:hypothetical protein K438DRAFT_2021986 [Mycena galopus ATCC 62051]|nr:hypothetical protein K438DRAFT_2021986 [Mycena galopus ATCC 62051]
MSCRFSYVASSPMPPCLLTHVARPARPCRLSLYHVVAALSPPPLSRVATPEALSPCRPCRSAVSPAPEAVSPAPAQPCRPRPRLPSHVAMPKMVLPPPVLARARSAASPCPKTCCPHLCPLSRPRPRLLRRVTCACQVTSPCPNPRCPRSRPLSRPHPHLFSRVPCLAASPAPTQPCHHTQNTPVATPVHSPCSHAGRTHACAHARHTLQPVAHTYFLCTHTSCVRHSPRTYTSRAHSSRASNSDSARMAAHRTSHARLSHPSPVPVARTLAQANPSRTHTPRAPTPIAPLVHPRSWCTQNPIAHGLSSRTPIAPVAHCASTLVPVVVYANPSHTPSPCIHAPVPRLAHPHSSPARPHSSPACTPTPRPHTSVASALVAVMAYAVVHPSFLRTLARRTYPRCAHTRHTHLCHAPKPPCASTIVPRTLAVHVHPCLSYALPSRAPTNAAHAHLRLFPVDAHSSLDHTPHAPMPLAHPPRRTPKPSRLRARHTPKPVAHVRLSLSHPSRSTPTPTHRALSTVVAPTPVARTLVAQSNSLRTHARTPSSRTQTRRTHTRHARTPTTHSRARRHAHPHLRCKTDAARTSLGPGQVKLWVAVEEGTRRGHSPAASNATGSGFSAPTVSSSSSFT